MSNEKIQISFYNTLSRKLEPFSPISANQVKMYVCGPTVYDHAHVGHGRAYTTYDVLYRLLSKLHDKVIYVRNVTDIDDKIIDRAKREARTAQSVSEEFFDSFSKDMRSLGLLEPTHQPKVSDQKVMKKIYEMVQGLVAKGNAYISGNDVYFEVASKADYGKLSHREVEALKMGARVEVNEQKKAPADFALWKGSSEKQFVWDSPFGAGRPGWHIECSAMASLLLGATIDIHGGGMDLIFPHHENELAQSEAYHQKQFSNYWLHNGFITLDQQKMSKSLGNTFVLKDAFKAHHPEALKMFFYMTHYRSPMELSHENISQAKQGLDKLYRSVQLGEQLLTAIDASELYQDASWLKVFADETGSKMLSSSVLDELNSAGPKDGLQGTAFRFVQALAQDLGTPAAVAILFGLATDVAKASSAETLKLEAVRKSILLKTLGQQFLGLFNHSADEFFKYQHHDQHRDAMQIEKLIAERKLARQAKDFARADEVRKMLDDLGVILEDGPNGTTWRLKN